MNNKIELSNEEKIEYIKKQDYAEENCILNVVAGSRAYGTSTPTSDYDERGIFMGSLESFILPDLLTEKVDLVNFLYKFDPKNNNKIIANDDKVYYELNKFMPLLLAQNPNIMELLWVDESYILNIDEKAKILIDNRKIFLSKNVKNSYVNYASQQLQRIKGHKKMIMNPQEEKQPEQIDFVSVVWNYTKNSELNKKAPVVGYVALDLGDHHFGLWSCEKLGLDKDESWVDKRGTPAPKSKSKLEMLKGNDISPDLIVKVNLRLFDEKQKLWNQYWTWKNNRNPVRALIEEKHNYDCKHASHLIRLLKMGYEILSEEKVIVKRPDALELLNIKNGMYSYEKLLKEVDNLLLNIDVAYKNTKLPDVANLSLAKDVMLEMYSSHWNISIKETKKVVRLNDDYNKVITKL